MYYDLCIKAGFKDWECLENSGCLESCIGDIESCIGEAPDNNTGNNTGNNIGNNTDNSGTHRVYRRATIKFRNGQESLFREAKKSYDVVCAEIDDASCLKSVSKLGIDLVRLPLSSVRHLRKTLPGLLVEKRLCVELCVSDGLYENKVLWMNSLRKLLKLGCKKCLVISSGAARPTELRGSREISSVLRVFGVGERQISQILGNSERVLRRAALRKYSADGCVVSLEDEGEFKRDFLLHAYE